MSIYDLYKQVQAGEHDDGVEIKRDIPVKSVEGFEQIIHVVRPVEQAEKPGSAILLFHGGGFMNGSPEAWIPFGKFLAATYGITVFSASYRLFKGSPTYPGLVQDAGDAWRWVQQHAATWHVDPERVAVGGDSAGGYVSTMMTVTLDDPAFAGKAQLPSTDVIPAALLCLWGPLDFVTRWYDQGEKAGPEARLFGGEYLQEPVAYYQANPLFRARKGLPPALFLYGSQDVQVAPRQGQLGCQAWQVTGNDAEFCVIDNVGHNRREEGQEEANAQMWEQAATFLQSKGL